LISYGIGTGLHEIKDKFNFGIFDHDAKNNHQIRDINLAVFDPSTSFSVNL
jgi:hypothetical protein